MAVFKCKCTVKLNVACGWAKTWVSSTLAASFRRHVAQTGIRQNLKPPLSYGVYITTPFSRSIKDPSQSKPSPILVLSARVWAWAHPRLFLTASFRRSHVDLLQLFIREEELDREWRRKVIFFVAMCWKLTEALCVLLLKACLVTSDCSAGTGQ